MIAVIQRVSSASVSTEGKVISSISQGILILLGVEKGDTVEEAKWLADKITDLRIFNDSEQKMNLSIEEIKGEILVVSQFTIPAKIKKGRRPSFDYAEKPEIAEKLYEAFCSFIEMRNIPVKKGVFGAMMDVTLTNTGPVTFIVEKKSDGAWVHK